MKLNSIYYFLLILFISCSTASEKLPADVLPHEKMVQVLADVQITEAALMLQNSRGNMTGIKAPAYYQFIFTKNKISEKQFRTSFNYYVGKVGIMDKMYEEVINEISKRQAEIVN